MERKIGEIFKYNGEWYQCVESRNCGECSLFTTRCGSGTKNDLADKIFGKECSKEKRSDNRPVIFKKLEKYGGFIKDNIRGEICQPYTIFDIDRANSRDDRVQLSENKNDFVFVVTKQNQ